MKNEIVKALASLILEGKPYDKRIGFEMVSDILLEKRKNELSSFRPIPLNKVDVDENVIDKSIIKLAYVLKNKYDDEHNSRKVNNNISVNLSNKPIFLLKKGLPSAKFFHDCLLKFKDNNKGKYNYSVSVHETEFYKDCILLLSFNCLGGAAIKNGDVVSVFNGDRKNKGVAQSILALATELGGKTLDAYTTNDKLPNLYSKFGYEEYGRSLFDPQYAPDDMPEDSKKEASKSSEDLIAGKETNSVKRPDVTLMGRKKQSPRKSIAKHYNKNKNSTTDYGLNATGIKRNFDKLEDFEDFDTIYSKREQALKKKK